jgi:hypothetical protein
VSGEELTKAIAGNILEQSSLRPSQSADRGTGADAPAVSREARIAIAAYYRAERRHFAFGGQLDDWLAAERELAQQEGADVIG